MPPDDLTSALVEHLTHAQTLLAPVVDALVGTPDYSKVSDLVSGMALTLKDAMDHNVRELEARAKQAREQKTQQEAGFAKLSKKRG
jgi:hypothetical protein